MHKILYSSAIAAALIFGSSAFARPDSYDDDDGYQEYNYADDSDNSSRSSKSKSTGRNTSSYDEEQEDQASDGLMNNSRFQNDEDEDDSYASKPRKRSRRQADEDDTAYEDVAYRNLDENKKKEEPSKPKFQDTPLHVGAHMGLGYAGTWNNQDAYGAYLNPNTWEIELTEKDPFAGYMGFIVDFGIVINYRLASIFCLVPEINFRMVDYMKESEVWYLKVDRGWYTERYPLDENMMVMDINVPLMMRLTFGMAYFELGGELNLNLTTSFTLTNSDFDYEEDMGGYWNANTFVWGLVFGGGATLDMDGKALDIGLRVIVDMNAIEKNELVDMSALNGTYRKPVDTRMWAIQLSMAFYFM